MDGGEAVTTGLKEPDLFESLAELLDGCADEWGVKGCSVCNVRGECLFLWARINNALATGRRLKALQYSVFIREFKNIKVKKHK